jgi:hypothetical protein
LKKKISELPWNEKFQHRNQHVIKHIDKKFSDIPENSDILIATPQIFDDYIRKIPSGKSVDLKKVRQDLAKKYKVDHTCPVTTGMFVRIVAEATYEKIQKGLPIEEATPFWRVISPQTPIAKKLSFGTDFLLKMRKEEGIS